MRSWNLPSIWKQQDSEGTAWQLSQPSILLFRHWGLYCIIAPQSSAPDLSVLGSAPQNASFPHAQTGQKRLLVTWSCNPYRTGKKMMVPIQQTQLFQLQLSVNTFRVHYEKATARLQHSDNCWNSKERKRKNAKTSSSSSTTAYCDMSAAGLWLLLVSLNMETFGKKKKCVFKCKSPALCWQQDLAAHPPPAQSLNKEVLIEKFTFMCLPNQHFTCPGPLCPWNKTTPNNKHTMLLKNTLSLVFQ